MPTLICPKCAGPMSAGFIIDHGDMNYASTTIWQAGAPETSFWTGLKSDGRLQRQVETFRCDACGYLESYAHKPPVKE